MHRKEGKMKKWTDIIEKLTMLTQLSLSLVTPLLLCLGLCWWSSNRWSLSDRLFLWPWRICHDSVEVLPVGGYASETDRKRKKKIKSIFQQTSLGKGTGQYGQ